MVGAAMMATAGQLHADTSNFLTRTVAAGGTVAIAAQRELEMFVRYHYRAGFRSVSNVAANHFITDCGLFITETSTGYNQKLWYPSGGLTTLAVTGSPTYSASAGVGVTAKTNFLDTRINCNTQSTTNVSIAIFHASSGANGDYLGNQASVSSRLLMHPQFLSTTTAYFDVGNNTAAPTGGRISGAVPSSDCRGLMMGVKASATQYLYIRGTKIAGVTNAPTTGLTFPSVNILLTGAGAADTTSLRNIGGYAIGKGFSENATLMTNLNTAWRSLMGAVSSSRIPV